jgi:hypothetical protein
VDLNYLEEIWHVQHNCLYLQLIQSMVDHICFINLQCILHDQFCGCEVSETKYDNSTTHWMCIQMIKMHIKDNLMFVPCIIIHSRNNQHNAQICTTALYDKPPYQSVFSCNSDPEAPWRWWTTAKTCRSQHIWIKQWCKFVHCVGYFFYYIKDFD